MIEYLRLVRQFSLALAGAGFLVLVVLTGLQTPFRVETVGALASALLVGLALVLGRSRLARRTLQQQATATWLLHSAAASTRSVSHVTSPSVPRRYSRDGQGDGPTAADGLVRASMDLLVERERWVEKLMELVSEAAASGEAEGAGAGVAGARGASLGQPPSASLP